MYSHRYVALHMALYSRLTSLLSLLYLSLNLSIILLVSKFGGQSRNFRKGGGGGGATFFFFKCCRYLTYKALDFANKSIGVRGGG